MPLRLPIGISDFREIREGGFEYIDKSGLLVEMLDQAGIKVLLLPRPRRFGKTVNLSMLRYFFEKRPEDLSHLFEGLAVWNAGDAYRQHFQRYPVIFLTFREVKATTFEECWSELKKKIRVLYGEHRALLEGEALREYERRDYQAILDDTAEPVLYRSALGDLSRYLHRATGERAMILIDEYDEPIHAGFVNGYTSEILDFFRAFLTSGLKDNTSLARGVVTGILRIARESIFSGLNNITVFSLLRWEFSTSFGFTEPEVHILLEKAGRLDMIDDVRQAYNGYLFGRTVVYNPWSVLNFLASESKTTAGYWVSVSANEIVRDLLIHHALDVKDDLTVLLQGGSVEQKLDENVALQSLPHNERALWSLLVFSGYLRAEPVETGGTEVPPYRLSIPNREVREVYTTTFHDWLTDRLRGHGGSLHLLTRALFEGDEDALEEQLRAFARDVLSYHDAGLLAPESLYHGFVAGLCAALEPGHRVRSNRESGKGRPDVLILPIKPGDPGVVLELQVARRKKTLDQALDEGTAQAEENDYAAEVRAAGADPVHVFVIAFDGKEVRVRRVGA
ncbi:MAG TPA: AAA family ATPase [Candidatus Nanopelagicales bacterium]|nr:AAA family ATPase [Candidatus Nanopelagicales bacterium]